MSKNQKTLRNDLTPAESVFGWCYIIARQFLISLLLQIVFKLLGLPESNLWLNFAFFAFNFVVIVTVYRKFLAAGLRQLGKRFGHVLGDCAACYLLYTASTVFVGLIIGLCFPTFSNANDANVQSLVKDQLWVTFVGTVILAPVAEEVLFRGVVFGTLYRWNRPLAYVLSALFFGAIHIMGYLATGAYTWAEAAVSMLQYLPAGLCFAWLYADTDTIFAPILVHTINNLIAITAMR